ncbi:MAG TPA: hypothetical protein VGE52_21330 [Pirellulales bacterium]
MDEADVDSHIREALNSLNAAVEAALREALASPIDLGHSQRLQFEVSYPTFGITLVQTGAEIIEESAIDDALPPSLFDLAAEADLDLWPVIEAALFPWFADRWGAAAGPQRCRPAYAFMHGGLDELRYDLEQRRWCEVSEVWPDE